MDEYILKGTEENILAYNKTKKKYIKFNKLEQLILHILIKNNKISINDLKNKIDNVDIINLQENINNLNNIGILQDLEINSPIKYNIYPLKVFFSVTNKCNANCIHCFMNSGDEFENEFTYAELCRIADSMESLGIMGISLTGGEPFTRADIMEFIEYCTKKDMAVSIATNGSLISKEISRKLIELNLKSITISVDAYNTDSSAKIRCGIDLGEVKKTVERLVTLKNVYESNTQINIRTSINKINKDEITDIYTWCENIGVDALKINNTNKLGRAIYNSNILIDDILFEKILLNIKNISKNGRCRVEMPIEKYLADKNNFKKLTQCTSTVDTINFNANGDVVPCGFCSNNIILGNLKKNKLEQILKTALPFNFNNIYCNECRIHKYENKDVITNPKFIISEEKC